MAKRREHIETLKTHAAFGAFERCTDACFRALYGAPAEQQIDIARAAVLAYLPAFERKHPDAAWARALLTVLADWLARHDRRTPDEPANADPADAAFLFGCDALLVAGKYPNDALVLAAACVCAINASVNARRTDAWMNDDPEGVELWRAQGYFPGRSVADNLAAHAAGQAAWSDIAGLLERSAVADAEAAAESETTEALRQWSEHEKLLILPSHD